MIARHVEHAIGFGREDGIDPIGGQHAYRGTAGQNARIGANLLRREHLQRHQLQFRMGDNRTQRVKPGIAGTPLNNPYCHYPSP